MMRATAATLLVVPCLLGALPALAAERALGKEMVIATPRVFGLLSTLFGLLTFVVLLRFFHADEARFRKRRYVALWAGHRRKRALPM
jgi:hypothetical protein